MYILIILNFYICMSSVLFISQKSSFSSKDNVFHLCIIKRTLYFVLRKHPSGRWNSMWRNQNNWFWSVQDYGWWQLWCRWNGSNFPRGRHLLVSVLLKTPKLSRLVPSLFNESLFSHTFEITVVWWEYWYEVSELRDYCHQSCFLIWS